MDTTRPSAVDALSDVREYRRAHAAEITRELADFIRLRNDVSDIPALLTNAEHLVAMMRRRGIDTRLIDTPSGRPVVFGERHVGADTTILIYGHYDGVSADPAEWDSDPYEPLVRGEGDEARMYGRSSADSKNAIVALLAALDALDAAGVAPGVNVKFFFDGEEEVETPSLPAIMAAHGELLTADLLIVASGEMHQSGLPTVTFGVRGLLILDVTTYTAASDMHSGHFGNFTPSAPLELTRLLASLKNADGTVAVPGFYDDVLPLSDRELRELEAVPRVEDEIRGRFGIARTECVGSLQELINRPTLNIRGMRSGYVGDEARNIIPTTAIAELDVRLVAGMDPERTFARITQHLRDHGWNVADREPTLDELRTRERLVRVRLHAAFPAVRTPLDSLHAQRVVAALRRAADKQLVVEPTEGGSLPMHRFGVPVVSIPISNYDCNQHTSNENVLLRCLYEGVDLFASVLLWE